MSVEVTTTGTYESQFLQYLFFLSTGKDDVARLQAVVHPHDFYDNFLGDVYQTVLNMVERGDPSFNNYLLVAEELSNKPIVRQRPWTASDAIKFLQILADEQLSAFTLAEAHRFAIIIRDTAQRRRIHGAMEQAMNAASQGDFLNALDEMQTHVRGVSRPGTGAISTVWDGIEEWKEECGRAAAGLSLSTGWPTIDHAFGPIRRGEILLLAARAGVGKTNGITSVANHNASRGRKVLICTMEMETPEMAERIVAQSMAMAPQVMREQHASLNINAAREHLPYLDNLRIYDQPLSVNQLSYVVKQCQADGFDPDLIIIDYIGLIVWEGNRNSGQYEKTSEIARSLKGQAKRLKTAILCCCQLNREAGDGTEEPFMHMLRDSGAIEEAADRILMMWKRSPDVAIKVAKNRHGKEGASILLRYNDGMAMEERRPEPHV